MTRHRTRLTPAAARRQAAAILAASRARYGDATMHAPPQTDPPKTDDPPKGDPPAGDPPKGDDAPKAQFTQADLDRIVSSRLAEDRKKHEAELEQAKKMATATETEKLQLERDQANSRAAETQQKAAERIARTEAKGVARDLDARPDRLDAILRQADLTGAVKEDGSVDEAAVKKAVESVLADYPEWKKSSGHSASGGELNGGSSGKPTFTRKQIEEMSSEERVRRIDEINDAMADGRISG